MQDLFLGEGAACCCGAWASASRLAAAQRLGPCGPCAGLELAAQHGVEGVVGEPADWARQNSWNCSHCSASVGSCGAAVEKVAGRFVEQGELALLHLFEIDIAAVAGEAGNAFGRRSSPSRRGIRG